MSNIVRRKIKNKIFVVLLYIFALVSVIPLILILFHITKSGISSISLDFFLNLPKPVGEVGGGISNAIVGTFLLIIMASIIAIPVGISIGIFLSEYEKSKFSYIVKISLNILQGTPSIVIGIVIYLWVVKQLGTFSAISGSVALSIMMLPLIITSTYETLKLLPKSLKESSFALGVPYYATILKIVLPAGINGILTGIILSISRIAGETAPLLFTAFGNPYMNYDVTQPISSLPHIIFTYSTSPYKEYHALAWGASFVLIFLVLVSLG